MELKSLKKLYLVLFVFLLLFWIPGNVTGFYTGSYLIQAVSMIFNVFLVVFVVFSFV